MNEPESGSPREMADTFVVAAPGELLGAWIALYLQDASPGAKIEVRQVTEMDAAAVVTHADTGRWLCLSANPKPDQSYVQALDRGAASVLGIGATRAEFNSAIQAVRRESGVYVPPEVVSWLVAHPSHRERRLNPPQQKEVRLTHREHDVLRLVLEGQSNQEIATSLTISPNTVRSHLHALRVKLEASNRARLIHRARELGFDAAHPANQLHLVLDVTS